MKTLDPGHFYALDLIDGRGETFLRFVKREGKGYPGNVGSYAGTNMQEVLRALIDRTKYLDNQIPHPSNKIIVYLLRSCIHKLERRAAERHGRLLKMPYGLPIEHIPVCRTCGHIACDKHITERKHTMYTSQISFTCDYCGAQAILESSNEWEDSENTILPEGWRYFKFEGRLPNKSFVNADGHICPACFLAHAPDKFEARFFPKDKVSRPRIPKRK